MATANIINQRADASRSLYQICVALKQRLAQVPDFEGYLDDLETQTAAGEDGGPVESLWDLLRTGHPLLVVYNSVQPEKALKVGDDEGGGKADKRSKLAIFRFVQACTKDLQIPSTECFMINDLLGEDTTGFVKVRPTRETASGSTARKIGARHSILTFH
jgi:cell division control protein 24